MVLIVILGSQGLENGWLRDVMPWHRHHGYHKLKLRGSSPRFCSRGNPEVMNRGLRLLSVSVIPGPKNRVSDPSSKWPACGERESSGNGEHNSSSTVASRGNKWHLSPASPLSWQDAQTRSTSSSLLNAGHGRSGAS